MKRPVMLPKRIVFMGTPEFACPSLRLLAESGAAPILVVTQPDRPSGRGRRLKPPPVKELALALGIEVFQPLRVKLPDARERLRSARPELIVVAAFGQILPQEVLDIPVLGCVNVHASLLPRHRGASPVAHAIWLGDRETGVSIMRMEAGLDTGPVYATEGLPITEGATAGEMERSLAGLGARLLVRSLGGIADGSLDARPQDGALATYAPRLKREDARLDFHREAEFLERQVRAMDPWPGAWFELRGEILKVWKAEPGPPSPEGTAAGTVLEAPTLRVACGGGSSLALRIIQRQGKRALPSEEVTRGFRIPPGTEI